MKALNIYLVDDHALFREGLKFLLTNSDFVNQIYEANNGKAFIEGLRNKQVDVALLDIEMPEMDGKEALRLALQTTPELKVIALSMYSDESYCASMIEEGASGFLLKNSNFSEVKKAIIDVWEGKNYFSTEILQSIVNNITKKTTPLHNDHLTERETEVLCQICRGRSNAEIAEILSISKRTVDKHRENLLLKTNSKNTANLVVFAIKQGYFEI